MWSRKYLSKETCKFIVGTYERGDSAENSAMLQGELDVNLDHYRSRSSPKKMWLDCVEPE